MKAIAIGALSVAIAMETIWMVATIMQRATSLGIILYPACVTLTLVGLTVSRRRSRWLATIVRTFIGVAFLGSVGDRFGVFGGPGAPRVSWGNFSPLQSSSAGNRRSRASAKD